MYGFTVVSHLFLNVVANITNLAIFNDAHIYIYMYIRIFEGYRRSQEPSVYNYARPIYKTNFMQEKITFSCLTDVRLIEAPLKPLYTIVLGCSP